MTTTKQLGSKQQQRREAIERLREWLAPGDDVYCVLRHVSASGMLRVIDLKTIGERDYGRPGDPRPDVFHIGGSAAVAIDYRYDDRKEGIRVSGSGMDMGFHVVYTLAQVVFSAHPALGIEEDPRATAWKEARSERDPRNLGYALNSRWL